MDGKRWVKVDCLIGYFGLGVRIAKSIDCYTVHSLAVDQGVIKPDRGADALLIQPAARSTMLIIHFVAVEFKARIKKVRC